jgi:lipoprotein-anchoring transpeptidase ErfK/SrfK
VRKLVIVTAVVVALAVAGGAAALYAYDSSREDVIAKGVRVAGVDVGGMRASRARAKLDKRVVAALERPVVVRYKHRRFVLTATRARVRVDLERMLAVARSKSRDGSLFGRAYRDLTGGRVDASVPLSVRYSHKAVKRFVRGIERRIDRPAKDATVEPSAASLERIPSKTGIRVRARRLAARISTALANPEARRVLRARTRVVEPKVTTAELPRAYPFFITVSRPGKRLRLWHELRLAKTYRIAVGRIGLETPAGLYRIETKVVNPAWHVPNSAWAGSLAGKIIPPTSPQNPLEARWMGFYDGAGIHGTADIASLGTAASHGCIRMSVPDVINLYNRVPLHTPIYIG